MRPTTGITITANLHAQALRERVMQRAPNQAGINRTVISRLHRNWLSIQLITQRALESAVYEIPGKKVEVLIDGYLYDVEGKKTSVDYHSHPAQFIAELYLSIGIEVAEILKGSFSCCILDKEKNCAFLLNDRRGSRPMFSRLENDKYMATPEINSLVLAYSDKLPDLDFPGICGLLLSGQYHANHTLFKNIKRIAQGTIIEIDNDSIKEKHYWRVKFPENKNNNNEENLFDALDELYSKAVLRVSGEIKKPVLMMSGGLDSRIILAYLNKHLKEPVPLVTYEYMEVGGDDAHVGEMIAEKMGCPIKKYQFSISDFTGLAEKSVLIGDCGVEVIDAPHLMHLWEKIGSDFESVLKGDECFGWHKGVASKEEALTRNFLFRLPYSARLYDLINKQERKETRKSMDVALDSVFDGFEEKELMDVKDKIYYEQRIANYVNPFTVPILRYMEQARPLLDEDIIDFITTLPVNARGDKSIIERFMRSRHPDLMEVPLAKKHSLPMPSNYVDLLRNNSEFYEFVINGITDNINKNLAKYIDIKRIRELVDALKSGSPLPPLKQGFASRIPMIVKITGNLFDNRVHPMLLILRILQVSLYLNVLENKLSPKL